MWTNIYLSVGVFVSQLINAWMGWETTKRELTDPQRRCYRFWFFFVGFIGMVCVGILAARTGLPKAAHLSISFQARPLILNSPISANIFYKNVGDGPASSVGMGYRTFIEDDISQASERSAVSKFIAWFGSDAPKLEGTGGVIQKDQEHFITANGALLTPEDINNLNEGRKILYVIAFFIYEDDFGKHTRQICSRLQPDRVVWNSCSIFNREVDSWSLAIN